jgi:hypothetical protein
MLKSILKILMAYSLKENGLNVWRKLILNSWVSVISLSIMQNGER